MKIILKNRKEIEIMAEGGKILAGIMKKIEKNVKPGIKTIDLERIAEEMILEAGGKCSFKGFRSENFQTPYPCCLCTSVNEEIVHVPPSEKILKEGDILKLDLGLFWKGYHLDMAITVPVGKISYEAQRLIRVTKKVLKLAIKKVKVGNTFGDIGNVIQRYVELQGFNVVRELCGHGIGKNLHEEPKILNYGKRKTGERIKEGMVFCIEPMVTTGDWRIKKTKDGFGYQTKDGSISAHFEHTVAVFKNGPKILTQL